MKIEENSLKLQRPLEKLINQNFKREIPLKVKIRREAKKSQQNKENPAIFVKFIFNAFFTYLLATTYVTIIYETIQGCVL